MYDFNSKQQFLAVCFQIYIAQQSIQSKVKCNNL